jgi:hypothetical protein
VCGSLGAPEVPEGLSPGEVGKEIGHHAHHNGAPPSGRRRALVILEAVVLSVVAVVAAWSGFSAAKWSTESSLSLAAAATQRQVASRLFEQALTYRADDAVMFNAWLGAVESGNRAAERVAEKRFRPEYRGAFNAWLATHPFTNPNAPSGPQNMPQYHPTGLAESVQHDARADALFLRGQLSAGRADDYIRTTVILASVLFLVGIATQLPSESVRIALVSVGIGLLIFAGILILTLPPPP